MAAKAYPDVKLYRYDWGNPGDAAMKAKLAPAVVAGPASASRLDESLAGKNLRIVTDNGPDFSWRFLSPTRLTMDGMSGEAGYGALSLGRMMLLTHLVPGTLQGYAVAWDRANNLATVYEMWFGGEPRGREVQRTIHHGYAADPSGSVPEERHQPTNRIEGKGLYWKQDAGPETLEFYPSVAYSHFVELTRMDGRQGYCAPSDYIKLTEDNFLYSRMEAEFSGILTAYVMDLNRLEQIGLRLGFNAADDLEYHLFRGNGEWLGQIAKFEDFGDTSGNPIKVDAKVKGARPTYRPFATMPKMTPAEVDAVVAKNTHVFDRASPMAGNGTPPTAALAGKSFTVRYDNGPVMEYRVDSADSLRWRKDGGAWMQARYNAWEPAPGVFMFGHLLEGEPHHDGHLVVADFDAGLATCYNGYLNTAPVANEAQARTLFGVVQASGVPDPGARRHERTLDMLGRALTWNYSPGLTSMHLYSTPKTVSWIIFTEGNHGGLEWSGPGEFVKIRDGLYYIYWLEEACNGTLGTILVNLHTMHDTGIGYHCGEEGLSISPVGALARHAGQFNLARFYQRKA